MVFWFLNENPFRRDERKRQISWRKSGLVDSGFVKTCDELVIGVDGLEDWAIDIRELQSHTAEVNMHGLAFILSFINFVRAASLFNERETMTLLFGIVALPMTIITSLCRILLLAIVIAFVEPEWTTILLIGYVHCCSKVSFTKHYTTH